MRTPAPLAHVELAELREDLGSLRLSTPELERDMEQSLVRHGQLTPVLACRQAQGWRLIDGFKRLRSARSLSWSHIWAQPWEGDTVLAKLVLWQCNQSHGLTELEEGWVVRALYRDDGLTQPRIAQLFRRHKSWVCRRLLLAEGLDDGVQADIRLGLLSRKRPTFPSFPALRVLAILRPPGGARRRHGCPSDQSRKFGA